MIKSIPDEWVRRYIDSLLEAAKLYPPESVMHESILLRAATILDMVQAWRDDPK